jgi:hypothetical protein
MKGCESAQQLAPATSCLYEEEEQREREREREREKFY